MVTYGILCSTMIEKNTTERDKIHNFLGYVLQMLRFGYIFPFVFSFYSIKSLCLKIFRSQMHIMCTFMVNTSGPKINKIWWPTQFLLKVIGNPLPVTCLYPVHLAIVMVHGNHRYKDARFLDAEGSMKVNLLYDVSLYLKRHHWFCFIVCTQWMVPDKLILFS